MRQPMYYEPDAPLKPSFPADAQLTSAVDAAHYQPVVADIAVARLVVASGTRNRTGARVVLARERWRSAAGRRRAPMHSDTVAWSPSESSVVIFSSGGQTPMGL